MEQTDLITIPPSVIDQLKKNVNKYILKDKKPEGFEEALRYIALEKASKSQLAKLNSFSNHHSLSNDEDKEKLEILDKMIVFAKNWTKHENTKKEFSNKIRANTDHPTGASTKKQSGREVDRLQPSLSSVKPYSTAQLKDSALMRECFRIIAIMKMMD
ncbi:hypothetical protein [Flavobacterium sp. LC2016-12]|uniref:hypothetical protein n=1 Tax=Flavobacterium sp. LC2016-12 TaxID=2783794 RepID=UPI00188AE30A|nr:hypothetical protein [Flavobacterium sp. LC2016-12]MBF4466217.1 hypothetical protein [Flavobacterium sp. LC2016-12]